MNGATILARDSGLGTADSALEGRTPSAERRRILSDVSDAASRVTVGALFLLLAWRIAEDFSRTGRLTGLLLLASELLVVVLMVVRRTAVSVDRSLMARVLTVVSVVGPPLVGPAAVTPLAADALTAAASASGLALILAGKLSLGRSFGLVPANRGVVSSGVYRFVRHPIYLGYLVTHSAFLAANPTLWNLAMLVGADTALMLRAVYEERTLALDAAYLEYCERVRWRVVPGVF